MKEVHGSYEVTVRGIRSLMQNPMAEEVADADEKIGKKGEIYVDQDEAEKRLIKNDKDVICQPASHFEASMIKSATDFKFKGHKTYKELFKAGVIVKPELIPHKNQEWRIDKRSVKIGKARVARCRPIFDEWELTFTIECYDDRIPKKVIESVLENSGYYYGVGDYRPRYGLFEVVSFKKNGRPTRKKT